MGSTLIFISFMYDGMKNDWIKLYLCRKPSFMSSERSYEESKFILFGVPFDATASFRPGARFAPMEIRRASENIEFSSLSGVKLADIGDLNLTNSVTWMLKRVSRIVGEILSGEKIPIILGGEHTLTLASALKVCKRGGGLIVLDAHLDLRDEFMDTRLNHTTWLRRFLERFEDLKMMIIGVREAPSDLTDYAEKKKIKILKANKIMKEYVGSIKAIKDYVSTLNEVYLSIDMDVLDPAYAPGVSNPEPCGLSPTMVKEIVEEICSIKLGGLDVVEVNPLFDFGQTSCYAAYFIYTALARNAKIS